MTWSYDPEQLGVETEEERKNSVRFLVGDTDTTDQQTQNEEIEFALSQTADNIYFAGAMIAEGIQAKFARRVTSEVDRTLRIRYSDMQAQYRDLAQDLKDKGMRWGNGVRIGIGGVNTVIMDAVRKDPLRPPATYRGEFEYPRGKYNDHQG